MEENKLFNKVIIFLFVQKNCYHCFLNEGWTTDVTLTRLCPYYLSGPWSIVSLLSIEGKFLDFIKNILICVPKMNEGLVGF